jgi:tripartite-type tricarboxylate transporter receptor subunit TctC
MRQSPLLVGSVVGAVLALGSGVPAASAADAYPDKPIKLVVGYEPGGGVDIMARLMQRKLMEAMPGSSVIVENRPGAGQNIGSSYVARSAPDGYTFLVGSAALAVNINLYPKLDYDPVKSFTPVALYAVSPNLLVVRENYPAKTVSELIAYAKKGGKTLDFSSSGTGSSQHLSGELFKIKTGVDALHIPYKGSAPALTALLGGQVDFTFMNLGGAKSLIDSHQLRALAITSSKRAIALPDVPTMAEAGVPDMDVGTWYGLLGPAGTPPAVVTKINAIVNKAVQEPDFNQRLVELGAVPIANTPKYFVDFLATDIDRWAKVIKLSHAKAE